MFFSVSNYYGRSKELPVKNSFQLLTLQWADLSTLLREGSKLGVVVGLVVAASSQVFSFNPTLVLSGTAVSGVCWLVTGMAARRLEPQAERMIQEWIEEKASQVKMENIYSLPLSKKDQSTQLKLKTSFQELHRRISLGKNNRPLKSLAQKKADRL